MDIRVRSGAGGWLPALSDHELLELSTVIRKKFTSQLIYLCCILAI